MALIHHVAKVMFLFISARWQACAGRFPIYIRSTGLASPTQFGEASAEMAKSGEMEGGREGIRSNRISQKEGEQMQKIQF